MSEEELLEEKEEEKEEIGPGSNKTINIEDIENLVRSGWIVWKEERYNRIRLKNPETRKTISIPYDEKLWEKIQKIKEEMRNAERAKKIKKALEEQGVEEETRHTKTSLKTTTDESLWTTFVGRHRPLIEALIQRVGWLQEAIIDIGLNTMILSLMIRNENPEKLPEILMSVKDKDKFVAYIMDGMLNIYYASKGAEEIADLRDRIRELEAENALLHDIIERQQNEMRALKETVEDLRMKFNMALSIMNADELRRLMKVFVASYYAPQTTGGELS